MTTTHVHRTARVCLLSAFLALALFSFFVLGSGRAHAQTVSTTSTTTTVVSRIMYTTQKGFHFSPSTLTVASGTTVKIINSTTHNELLYSSSQNTYFSLPAGQSMKVVVTQSQSFFFVCRPGGLTITMS